MAISSPNVISTGGGGRQNQVMQGLALLQQGVVAAQQLQIQRSELELKQEEFRSTVRTQIAENPAQFALMAEFQPDLAKNFLQTVFPPLQVSRRDQRRIRRGEMQSPAAPNYDRLLDGMSHLGNILDADQRNQAVTSLLHAEGVSWTDFEDPPEGDPGSRGFSFSPAGGQPEAAPGDPGYVGPDQQTFQPMTWEEQQDQRHIHPDSQIGTRHDAETMRGEQAAEAGTGPGPREPDHLTGSRSAGMELYRQQLQEGLVRGDDSIIRAQRQQLSREWQPGEGQTRVPIITNTVGRAGLLERDRSSGMPDGPLKWDQLSESVQNAFANPNAQGVWDNFNEVFPNIQEVGASGFDKVHTILGLDKDEVLTAEHMRDYNASRAVLMHAMRMGMTADEARALTPEQLARDFFWATDQRLSAHEIREMNNLDQYTDGKFNPGATREAQAARFSEIITSKETVTQMNEQYFSNFSTGLVFRDVAGEKTLDALSTHLHKTADRIANGRYNLNEGRARQIITEAGQANERMSRYWENASDRDKADFDNMLANNVVAMIRDTPGGVAGIQQSANGGYSLEMDLANMAVGMMQNSALVRLQAHGVNQDAVAMALTVMSSGPTPGEFIQMAKANAEILDTLYDWKGLDQNERGKLYENDPTVRAIVTGIGSAYSGHLGIPLIGEAFQHRGGFLNFFRRSTPMLTPDVMSAVQQLGGGGQGAGLSPGAQAYLDQRR